MAAGLLGVRGLALLGVLGLAWWPCPSWPASCEASGSLVYPHLHYLLPGTGQAVQNVPAPRGVPRLDELLLQHARSHHCCNDMLLPRQKAAMWLFGCLDVPWLGGLGKINK